MRDGPELADALHPVINLGNENERTEALRGIFNRGEIRYLGKSEEAPSAGHALMPHNSRNLRSTNHERTLGHFKIAYPHYLSDFGKLYSRPSINGQATTCAYDLFHGNHNEEPPD
jgi:hypothetical protein